MLGHFLIFLPLFSIIFDYKTTKSSNLFDYLKARVSLFPPIKLPKTFNTY